MKRVTTDIDLSDARDLLEGTPRVPSLVPTTGRKHCRSRSPGMTIASWLTSPMLRSAPVDHVCYY
jgi:hypothetical protein